MTDGLLTGGSILHGGGLGHLVLHFTPTEDAPHLSRWRLGLFLSRLLVWQELVAALPFLDIVATTKPTCVV